MKSETHGIRKGLQSICRDAPILPILAVCLVISCIFVPNFASFYNIKVFFLQASDLLVVCCGVTFVVLNGGIDFSVTSVLSLGSVIGAYIMVFSPLASNPSLSIAIAMIAMLAVGAAVGLINGFAVAVLKMPSFIATLATQLAFSGVAVLFCNLVTEKTSITGLPDGFFILGGEGGYFMVPILIAAAAWAFCFWLLKYTRFGRSLYAVGINPKTAYISGIPVKKVIMTIMFISGMMAALASVLSTARNQVGMPSLGDKLFISIMAAIIVGGTSTAGGFGGLKQTLLGVLFITLINNTMNLLGVEWYVITVIQGILILVSTMMGMMNGIGKRKTKMMVLEAKK